MFRLPCLISIALALTASAAPMTVKEIDFLLRQQTPEADISRELQQRRLLAGLDNAGEEQLREHGATPKLIAMIKQGHLVLSPVEAQTFAARTAAPTPAPPGPTASANPAPQPAAAPSINPNDRHRFTELLSEKLVHLEGDELKSFDAKR